MNWGSINCPSDSDTIESHLKLLCNESQVVICELGVERGHTGNAMVSVLKSVGVPIIKYYGIDNLNYHKWDQVIGKEKTQEFAHSEMQFIEGDRNKIQNLESIDFGFIDACHCAECVFQDSIAMSQRIKIGGAMGFHDTSLLGQYPTDYGKKASSWQHYDSGKSIRPINVVEGILMARGKWSGNWELTAQTGDDLSWGGIRIYRKLS